MIKLAIAATLGALAVLGSVFQPDWAPDPIPLVPGQEYRTGSPLSKPGFFGLFGAIGESIVGGDSFTGGGTVLFDVDTHRGGPTQAPHITVNGQQHRTIQTIEEARQAQDAIDWSKVENKQRTVIPVCKASQGLYHYIIPDDETGVRLVYFCQ